jgi:hypothetical protein
MYDVALTTEYLRAWRNLPVLVFERWQPRWGSRPMLFARHGAVGDGRRHRATDYFVLREFLAQLRFSSGETVRWLIVGSLRRNVG